MLPAECKSFPHQCRAIESNWMMEADVNKISPEGKGSGGTCTRFLSRNIKINVSLAIPITRDRAVNIERACQCNIRDHLYLVGLLEDLDALSGIPSHGRSARVSFSPHLCRLCATRRIHLGLMVGFVFTMRRILSFHVITEGWIMHSRGRRLWSKLVNEI